MTSSTNGHDWQLDAQALWDQGQRQAAIDRLLERINAASPAIPKVLGLQLVYYIFLVGDLVGAERFLRRLHQVHPNDGEILENLAVMVGRQGRAEEAVVLFEQVVALLPSSANAWDGLTACLAELERFAEAQQAGKRALALKTQAAQPLQDWQFPPGTLQQHLQRPGHERRQNVIAFSLWGSAPPYLRGALRNALLIPEIYPGWLPRFYLDESVPEEFRSLLMQLGSDCRLMPMGQSQKQKLCWRFLVANDPGVGRFLVRDCDSVVNQREAVAVQQWIDSDHWFHVMRDWWTHTDPILAGLWGGIAGVLPDLQGLLSSYTPAAKETANVDQWFLRDVLWGSIRANALIHDRCFGAEGSSPWPTPTPVDDRHVGQNEFAVRRQNQAIWLASWLQRFPCLQLEGEDSFALIPQPQINTKGIVLARGSTPLVSDPPPAMPTSVSGRVINLDRATERWDHLAAQIERLGWGSTHQRYPAQSASLQEAQAVGLPSAGYLGLWRSTRAVLEAWLAGQPGPGEVLHLIEDDAVLHPALPQVLQPWLACNPAIDLLFTESFLTVPLYRRFRALEEQRRASGEGILFLNGGQYLACASSVLLSVTGANRMLNAMQAAEATGKVPVNDLFFRQLIRSGKITAAITLPFFSTIAPVEDSAIQTGLDQRITLSKHVDLALRRLLYFQTWEPQSCGIVLQEIADVLSRGLAMNELERLIVEMFALGRGMGWLGNY